MTQARAFTAAALLASAAHAQRFEWTHAMVPPDEDSTAAMAFGDVDGDGDLDALVGNYGQSLLLRNDGTGAFTDTTATSLPSPLLFTLAVALEDVDGDGDLDAFVANNDSFGLGSRLYLNDGTGVYVDVTATNFPNVFARAFALGDVDGDGDVDLFVGTSPQDRLLSNDGTGVFADVTATNLPALAGDTRAVVLGDVDGDGDVDAFLGEGYDNSFTSLQNRLYQNDGAGVFTDVTASHLPVLLDYTQSVALGDVDGDADLDALLGNWGFPDRLYLNDGSGVFADVSTLPALSDFTLGVALGDVDGDGDLDGLAGNSAFFTFRGESLQDRLYLNDGAGVFTDAAAGNLPASFDDTRAVTLGDVDGDGDLDSIAGNVGGSVFPEPCRLYRNDGAGTFTDVTATNLPPVYSVSAVAFGDVEGDGDLDAFAGSQLHLNDGTGVFVNVTSTHFPFPPVYPYSIALGDVDGDGDIDAFMGDALYLNAGTGVFANVTSANLPFLPGFTGVPAGVALGDVDADGDLDAFLAKTGGPCRLYSNDGQGVFADLTATNLPALPLTATSVALGDVDGDGDLDALIGSWGLNRLYGNDGTGDFADVTATSLPGVFAYTNAVALGDLDEDGDLDAFVGNSYYADVTGGQDAIYRNDGTGVFTDVTAATLPALANFTRSIALGDVDGDGDLDAIAGVEGLDRLYTNSTCQLVWRGIPRAGKPLTLEIDGPPAGAWWRALSAGTASLPIPPFGILRLDPASLVIAGAGSLDAQGRARLTIPVPALPALVGVTLYEQAVVGPPFRLTNLEIVTFTAF